ncbi:SNF1-interacting protein [Podila epigama]|nr:SNF1-interacting protein [Podila epigama]
MPSTPPCVQAGPTTTEGVAAMIPVANITLEDTLLDNPNFRANIKLFEGQVFFIESWLVALQRSMNQFTEEWKRLNEVTSALNKRAEVPLLSQGMLSSQYTIPAMKLVGGAFRTTLALKNNYINEVNEKVLKPLDDFLKTDLKEFKESKRAFDKALEKYESTLAKYNGQSKQKEPSALREEAFQLYDTRKAYIQAAMSCSMLCIKFQDALDQLVLGVFLDLIATQHDYFSGNADHFGSMALQVLQLKTYMKDHKEASAIAITELEQNKERYMLDAIEYWKPSRSLRCYSNATPVTKPTIGLAALGPTFAAQVAGQIPINTLMRGSATMSSISTVGSNRLPLPSQQFQSSLAPITTSPGATTVPSSSQSAPLESGTDSLSVSTRLPRTNSSSSSLYQITNCLSPNSIYSAESSGQDFTPTTKQGYLNIRIPQPKNRAPVWQRKYFFIQEGEFGFESVVSNPTVGSQVVQSERIAVLLCEVRYGSSANSQLALNGGGSPSSGSQGLAMVQMERRFCFEVVCATQSYLLQAETEDDLMSWVSTFEAAKRDVFMQQNIPRRPEPEEPYSPMVSDNAGPSFSFSGSDLMASAAAADSAKTNNESETGEANKPSGSLGLGWAASVPGVSLLLGSYAGNTTTSTSSSSSSSSSSATATASKVEGGTDNDATGNDDSSGTKSANADDKTTKQADINEPQDASGSDFVVPAFSQQAKEGSPLPSLDISSLPQSRSMPNMDSVNAEISEHTRQQSEIEKLMTSSHHLVPKATPIAISEIPNYPMELVVRNRELHLRFHGTKIHSKEYVLHSWTSGYRDDSRPGQPIMVYGRIFLTQSGMYFYARDMSIETKRMYRFSTIRGIECEQKDISTEWRIETIDGVQHVFCQFTLTETEYQVLHLIWTNVHQAKDRLPVKELFRQTMQITNKPKGIAGSGSLAETESSHQTSRDCAIGSPVQNEYEFSADGQSGPNSEAASVRTIEDGWNDLVEAFPTNLEVPSGPVMCGCPGHLEKVELEETFNMSAKTLNRLLFATESPVWREFHNRRSNTVQSVGDWVSSGDKKTRTVKFLMVVNNPLVKLNQADCVETQVCEVEEDHLRYSYTVKSSVLAMPYSDAFTPIVRYCITFVDKNRSKLTCSSGIEWHKNPLVKAMIKGAVFKGTADTIRDLAEIIRAHLDHNHDRKVPCSGSKQSKTENNSGNSNARPIRTRSESAGIVISLQGPDDKRRSILLDPEAEGNGSDVVNDKAAETRVPGARRHTVSTGAGSGGVSYSGTRVLGQWPTGSQPVFVPVGSKESRTKLLGRPSRANLPNPAATDGGLAKQGDESSLNIFSMAWFKKHVLGHLTGKDDKERARVLNRLLYIVLVVSSLINILAALNSQRMLDSAWRLKVDRIASNGGPLRGYSEPLERVYRGERDPLGAHDHRQEFRNVRVAARAVYLRDLEEQMMRDGTEEFAEDGENEGTIDVKSFGIFLEVRDTFRPWPKRPLEWFSSEDDWERSSAVPSISSASLSTTSLAPTITPGPRYDAKKESDGLPKAVPRYPWLHPQHRRWATQIIFQRDRVGILRHDLLVTFEVLKQLERRLLETEYVNWIMDEQSRCRLWERRRRRAAARDRSKSSTIGENDAGRKGDGEEVRDGREEEEEVDEDDDGHAFLRRLETNQGLSAEAVKEQLYKHARASRDDASGHERSRSKDEEERRRQAKWKVTREFCQGVEHQVELFIRETKSSSSSKS